jgi:hypothetical protein
VRLGLIALVAHSVADGRVKTVGLQLAEPEPAAGRSPPLWRRIRRAVRRAMSFVRRRS